MSFNNDVINICLATDSNYVQHAGAVIASTLKHAAKDDQLAFYIIEDQLSDDDKSQLLQLKQIKSCIIDFIQPDYAKFPEGKFLKYISRATLLRLQVAELLPDCNRVIYLDCDIVVIGSLKELWDSDLGNNLAAGAADYNSKVQEHSEAVGCKSTYVNAGALLFDLEKMRTENISEKYLTVAEQLGTKATLLDQDIINVTMDGRILPVPLKWNLSTGYFKRRYNYQYYSDEEIIAAVKSPVILHFSGKKKPWIFKRSRHPFWPEYFSALKDTPWHKCTWMVLVKKIFFPTQPNKGPAGIK